MEQSQQKKSCFSLRKIIIIALILLVLTLVVLLVKDFVFTRTIKIDMPEASIASSPSPILPETK